MKSAPSKWSDDPLGRHSVGVAARRWLPVRTIYAYRQQQLCLILKDLVLLAASLSAPLSWHPYKASGLTFRSRHRRPEGRERAAKPNSRSQMKWQLCAVLPEAVPVGPLPALLRRTRPRSAMSAVRRHQPSRMRKLRTFAEDLPNRLNRRAAAFPYRPYERAGRARKRSSAQGVVPEAVRVADPRGIGCCLEQARCAE
jgi:hypothetical protein